MGLIVGYKVSHFPWEVLTGNGCELKKAYIPIAQIEAVLLLKRGFIFQSS